MVWIKIIFALYLLYNSFLMYTIHMKWIFIQNVNLIFHEAGHILFIFFGDFLSILGATITELGIPLIVAGHFLLQKQFYGVGFSLWWLSTAFSSISVYAADASTRVLPLITGDSSSHDWGNMLGTLNLLTYDKVFGGAFMFLSIVSLVGALFFFYSDISKSLKKRS